MNVTYIRGWYIIIPTMTEIIIVGLLLVIFFFIGRISAFYFLGKYGLKDIAEEPIKEKLEELKKAKITIDNLKEKNKLYVDTLAGVRHLTRRIEG